MAMKMQADKANERSTPPTVAVPDPRRSEVSARMALSPSVNAAAVLGCYGKPLGVEPDDIGTLMERLDDDVKDVWTRDTKRAEAMLFGQAHALQAIFTTLARRAANQENLQQWEAYLRMALKAQNQCRMTLETLATIKDPPMVIARQANINNGGLQQVNNGVAKGVTKGLTRGVIKEIEQVRTGRHARAANAQTAPTGLLEAQNGEWMVTRAAGKAGGADPHLAPVGEVHRPAKRRREDPNGAQRVQGWTTGSAAATGARAE